MSEKCPECKCPDLRAVPTYFDGSYAGEELFCPDCHWQGQLPDNERGEGMSEHKWRLVLQRGDPRDTVDKIEWCECCGCVRHSYSYDNGKTSQNYPVFYVPGIGKRPNSQECVAEPDSLTDSATDGDV